MKNLKIAVLALACVVAATGCREEKSLNEAGLSEATYEPSGVAVQPMVYPGTVSYTHLTLPTNREV